MLMNVPENKNCLLKLYLPIDNDLYIYMVYLLFKYFKKIYFYKPMLNFRSGEFYIICLNKKKVPDKIIKELCKKSFKPKKVNDLGFILQLYEFSKQIIEKRNKQLDRILYLMDNYEKITDKDYLLIDIIREKRIKEWIKKYKL
jgi:hypothetical protein